jgi:UDP-N-acetylglucosamine transferase subunit ALG13
VIFVTVGTQVAFDRLITAVDEWAGAAVGREVFAQIGPTRLRPRHIEYAPFVSPQECTERMLAAKAIVAHAGMGTILTALEMGKPLLVMPRRAALGEHRNDHQLATAHRFAVSAVSRRTTSSPAFGPSSSASRCRRLRLTRPAPSHSCGVVGVRTALPNRSLVRLRQADSPGGYRPRPRGPVT